MVLGGELKVGWFWGFWFFGVVLFFKKGMGILKWSMNNEVLWSGLGFFLKGVVF